MNFLLVRLYFETIVHVNRFSGRFFPLVHQLKTAVSSYNLSYQNCEHMAILDQGIFISTQGIEMRIRDETAMVWSYKVGTLVELH